MRRIAILGGGFGLYGHFKSIIDRGYDRVILEKRVHSIVTSRPELCAHVDAVEWVDDVLEVAETLDVCICALSPMGQAKRIRQLLCVSGTCAIGLEKPIACNPAMSLDLVQRLIAAQHFFRVNYSMVETPWYCWLQAATIAEQPLTLQWCFRAHHLQHNIRSWKRAHAEGGGAIRFYGIHLIAVAARLGYDAVVHSTMHSREVGGCEQWLVTLCGPGLANWTIEIDTNSTNTCFELKSEAGVIFTGRDPFAWQDQLSGRDIRCGLLEVFHDTLLEQKEDAIIVPWYHRTIALWQTIELCTEIIAT